MTVDMTRYSRQILFPPIGKDGQARLQSSRIAIVGMGALGTALANHMVRAGVGYIRIIDRDFVEESNLQRQMLYDEMDAQNQLPKAIAAKEKLERINSSVTIEAHVTDLTWRNAEKLLSSVDLILDGTDNFSVRYLINDVSIKHQIPWIYGGAVSARGMTFTIRPGITPCLRCLFPDPPAPGSSETCDTAGVIGPVVQIVASFQATEALKLLIGATEALDPRMRHFELWDNHYIAMKVKAKSDCPVCKQQKYEFLEPAHPEEQAISLCGRQTIQISPADSLQMNLNQLAEKLEPVADIEKTPFLLRATIDPYRLVIFPDGRVLVQGTDDISIAKSLVAKYVGM
ncbi:ThiF family adenylyltransferase [Thermoflavimicrobium dichotomicum]|uniref:Adenylyltransferase and sulfurtransferase n=1 Tax=Thermoflavimicrobium dichotomicum TaxID=46223 RepID=A0A1I3TUD3_9BACL|nr:ThiF family adenylyltransferase [Thermoflavimicrobium dichotomicum]SFJ73246.1 adenylyltransferase and sulfurtransferase [Thermoflavimicrobium dichotomicum]